MAESIEQLSFELTAGALAEQERGLSGLRAGAGTVLAAASIAGSFFGAKTNHGSLGVLGDQSPQDRLALRLPGRELRLARRRGHPVDSEPDWLS